MLDLSDPTESSARMNRGERDLALAVALGFVAVAIAVSWVIANWELIVLGISVTFVAVLFGLAIYLLYKGGVIRF